MTGQAVKPAGCQNTGDPAPERHQGGGAERYLKIAQEADVFLPQEIEVLKEVLEDTSCNPRTTYRLLSENVGALAVGFVIFGKTPMTDFCWDIYWLVVRKQWQGKGYGKRLLERVEQELRQGNDRAIMRLETSTKREHTVARGLYLKEGFKEMGRIPDFYHRGDDLIIFYKAVGVGIDDSRNTA